VAALVFNERRAAGEAAGLLVLHHGRGTDEHDLLSLGEALDPERRLHVVLPRAPLRLGASPGWHWYLVPRVGYPASQPFTTSCGAPRASAPSAPCWAAFRWERS